MSENYYPEKFDVYIGGYMGTSYKVQWDGGHLEYVVFGQGYEPLKTTAIAADEAKWKTFWAAIDRISAWDWKDDYTKQGVMDGTSWGVEIVLNGRQLESGGSNAYPPKFTGFLKAVQQLLGGEEFA